MTDSSIFSAQASRARLDSPGMHTDVSWADYLRHGALSQSDLCELARSPAHLRHRRTAPDEPSDEMVVGKAIHCAVLEPERFQRVYAIGNTSDRRTKAWKAFEEAHPDQVCLTENQGRSALGIASSVRGRPYIRTLLEYPKALREVSMAWQLQDGTLCKGRCDLVIPELHVIVDLKSTRDASLFSFARSIAEYRLHVQAAWYSWGYALLNGGAAPSYYLIAYEREPPYGSAVYKLTADAIAMGRSEIDFLLQLHQACVAADAWPDRSEVPVDVGLPTWYDPDFAQLAMLLDSLSQSKKG